MRRDILSEIFERDEIEIDIFLEIGKSGLLPSSTPAHGSRRVVVFRVRGDRYHHHRKILLVLYVRYVSIIIVTTVPWGDLSPCITFLSVFMFSFRRRPPSLSESLRRAVSDITLLDHSFCIFLFCILSSTVLFTFSMFFKCPKKKIGLSVSALLETVEVVEVVVMLVEFSGLLGALPRLLRYFGREDVCVSPSRSMLLPAAEVQVWRISLDCCVERDKGSSGLS